VSFRYSHFRILLFAVALGLASVWMWRGFAIANEYVSVDLPVVHSEEILQVFPIGRRWMPIEGGSGPDSPHVSLYLKSENDGVRTFRLGNYLDDKPIYVFLEHDAKSKLNVSVPYFLECLAPGKTESVAEFRDILSPRRVHRIDPQKYVEFSVHTGPEIKGRCWVSVPYFRDAASAVEQFRSTRPNISNRDDFERQIGFYLSQPFFTE
jgi:hypothetical protein